MLRPFDMQVEVAVRRLPFVLFKNEILHDCPTVTLVPSPLTIARLL
jgi:hypothetical protein